MIYCDTSFLISVYTRSETGSPLAVELYGSFDVPIAFTWLVELELINKFRRDMNPRELKQSLKDIDDSIDQGILLRSPANHDAVFQRALALSKQYAPTTKCRAADILHVALAIELVAEPFYSLDNRQRTLAKAARLKVLPQMDPTRRTD